jgi:multidrug resistance protein, MATE family
MSMAVAAEGRLRSYKSLVQLGLPLTLAGGTAILVDAITLAVVSRYSTAALAGVAGAIAVYEIASMTVSALLFGHQIHVARALGAQDADRADAVTATNMVIGIGTGVGVVAVLIAAAHPVMSLVTSGPAVAAGAAYLSARAFAVPAQAARLVLVRTSNAHKQSLLGLESTAIVGTISLVLSIVLVLGPGPLPALGAAGAGIAGAVATWAGVCILWWRLRKRGLLPTRWIIKSEAARTSLRTSWPMAAGIAADYFAVLLFFVILGQVSADDLAAGRVDFQLAQVSTMMLMGLSQGSVILQSRAIGAGDDKVRERIRRYGTELLLIVGAGLAILTLVLHDALAIAFSPDHSIARSIASGLLVVAATTIPVAWALGSVATLRASNKTMTDTVINLGTTWLVQLPVAYILVARLGLGTPGAFLGMFCYWIARGAISQVLGNPWRERLSSLARRAVLRA